MTSGCVEFERHFRAKGWPGTETLERVEAWLHPHMDEGSGVFGTLQSMESMFHVVFYELQKVTHLAKEAKAGRLATLEELEKQKHLTTGEKDQQMMLEAKVEQQ